MNITSNLAFRQVFSDNIQQAISPEETSQVFVNKDHEEYSFNFLAHARSHVADECAPSSPVAEHQHRQTADHSPFPGSLPVYFSFSGAADGVSRKETVEDPVLFLNEVGGNPIISPSIVQRLDLRPRFELPLHLPAGLHASGTGRVTFYSNSSIQRRATC